MGFAVTHLLAQILDRECMLAMATSTSHIAATFLEVARLVKEIGTAYFSTYVIVDRLRILENMTSVSRILMLLWVHRCVFYGQEREAASWGGHAFFSSCNPSERRFPRFPEVHT